jgi:cobalamin synthase
MKKMLKLLTALFLMTLINVLSFANTSRVYDRSVQNTQQKTGFIEQAFGPNANLIMIIIAIVAFVLIFGILKHMFKKFFIAVLIALIILAFLYFSGFKV